MVNKEDQIIPQLFTKQDAYQNTCWRSRLLLQIVYSALRSRLQIDCHMVISSGTDADLLRDASVLQ